MSPDRQVLVIHPGELAIGITFDGELENVFARLLRDAEERPGLILAIEHFELLLVSRVPRLLSEALDRGTLCLMGTMLPQFAGRLRPPLARRSRLIPLPEMDWLAVRTILIGAAESLAASLGVTIDPALVEALAFLLLPCGGPTLIDAVDAWAEAAADGKIPSPF